MACRSDAAAFSSAGFRGAALKSVGTLVLAIATRAIPTSGAASLGASTAASRYLASAEAKSSASNALSPAERATSILESDPRESLLVAGSGGTAEAGDVGGSGAGEALSPARGASPASGADIVAPSAELDGMAADAGSATPCAGSRAGPPHPSPSAPKRMNRLAFI